MGEDARLGGEQLPPQTPSPATGFAFHWHVPKDAGYYGPQYDKLILFALRDLPGTRETRISLGDWLGSSFDTPELRERAHNACLQNHGRPVATLRRWASQWPKGRRGPVYILLVDGLESAEAAALHRQFVTRTDYLGMRAVSVDGPAVVQYLYRSCLVQDVYRVQGRRLTRGAWSWDPESRDVGALRLWEPHFDSIGWHEWDVPEVFDHLAMALSARSAPDGCSPTEP